MTWQQYVIAILQSPAFWTALLAVKAALLRYFAPNFPNDLNTAIDALVLAIASVITGVQLERQREAHKVESMKDVGTPSIADPPAPYETRART